MNATLFTLNSELVLRKKDENFLNNKRVLLLENIIIYGSISKAAKFSGITYKTAWDWIEKMNYLSVKPVVQRISGGVGGGGTLVTMYARELIRVFKQVEALEKKHLQSLEASFDSFSKEIEDAKEGKNSGFSFSQLDAEVINITQHEKNAKIILKLSCGTEIISQVTSAFVEANNLKEGSMVSLLIESDSVSVSRFTDDNISSRNRLETKVKDIVISEDDVLLTLSVCDEESISSRITYKSYENLKIKIGDKLIAMFKAYNITIFCA